MVQIFKKRGLVRGDGGCLTGDAVRKEADLLVAIATALDFSDLLTIDSVQFFGTFTSVQTQKQLFQSVTWSHRASRGRTEYLVDV